MDIEFLTAKNNEQTVRIDSIFLHSSYNPSREAESFVKNLKVDFIPTFILITEPALGYILPFLQNRFEKAKIIIVRYTKSFLNKSNFKEILFSENFKNELNALIPEEKLFSTLFIKWEPSAKIFKNEDQECWLIIKNTLTTSKTVLITRQYFEKKWLLNSCNFLKYCTNTVKIKNQVNKPVLICASGPSLESIIPFLQNNCTKFFIICLSSAISVLDHYKITPDLYMSTDGGFWANYHLRKLQKEIPLALSVESFCNKQILQNQTILPLIYDDGISSNLKNISNINFYKAYRNGTVSGTALQFALSISNSDIYFTGLDLASNKGFQHTQPNELEKLNSNYNRLFSLEKKQFQGSLKNESLEIYKDWFMNFNPGNRNVYRIINKENKKNSFNYIKDITVLEFQNLQIKKSESDCIFINDKRNDKVITLESAEYFKLLSSNSDQDYLLKNVFLLDYASLQRNPDNQEIQEKISLEIDKLLIKIKDVLNG